MITSAEADERLKHYDAEKRGHGLLVMHLASHSLCHV